MNQTQRTNSLSFHFYEEPKVVKLRVMESRRMAAQIRGMRVWGFTVYLVQSFSFKEWKSSGDRQWAMVLLIHSVNVRMSILKIVNCMLHLTSFLKKV